MTVGEFLFDVVLDFILQNVVAVLRWIGRLLRRLFRRKDKEPR